MIYRSLEIIRVQEALADPLADFFQSLRKEGLEKKFHPHPLTDSQARQLAHYNGLDLYYVIWDGRSVLGYGLLRGWDEGYSIPSLGIALHYSVRGMGMSELFMHFLHAAAKLRGARKIRLKVYPDNRAAIKLYQKVGYVFRDKEKGQLVGFLDL
jgi:ribosomal-protein-alanine N-acetyltransferase